MKKGFILALLVVAMVALVLPVSARAPIIKSLPVIIIGDKTPDNYDTPSNHGIMRYAEVLDLGSSTVVDWNNDVSYTSDSFHAYLFPADASPETTVKPYVAGRIIDPLTSTEYADALAATDTPSTTTDIMSWSGGTDADNWFVNLFDAGRHSSMTDPAAAIPAADGLTPDAAYDKTVGLRLVCGVTSGTVLAASDAALTVHCTSNVVNSIEQAFTPVREYSFNGTAEGWTWTTSSANPTPVQTTPGSGTTGIGFIQATPVVVSDSGACAYAGWFSPLNIPCTDAEANRVYRATALLESTSPTPETALGFRLRYHNRGFATQGFIRFQTAAAPLAGDVLNTPTSGSPMTAKLFWACHPDLGDQSDAGASATQYPAGDMRDYRVCFEMLGFTGEQGTMTLEALTVDRFVRPDTDPTPAVSWGTTTGAIGFDNATAGFTVANAGDSLWLTGTATPVAGSLAMTLAAANGSISYLGRKPAAAAAFDSMLHPVSNHLYRFSVTIAAGNRDTVPCYRIVVNSLFKVGAGTPTARNISWIDWLAFNDTTGGGTKSASYKPNLMTACPFAPATSGSVIDSYIFSQNVAATSAGATIFLPVLDLFDKGLFGATGSSWAAPTSSMTYSAASWEDLGPDF